MKVIPSKFKDVNLFKLKKHSDIRGSFFELFNKDIYEKYPLIKKSFTQSNIAISKKNVLRGLHYQIKLPQSQLVTIINGDIFYVVVDVRSNSKNFLKYQCYDLSSNNINQIFTPPGFACGYLVKSSEAILLYNVSKTYKSRYEAGLKWNDPQLNIKWPKRKFIINQRDANFKNIENKLANEFSK